MLFLLIADYLQTFEVLNDYANDDIEIVQGDIVLSDGIEKNGWLLAQIGHERGLVPSKFVQRLKNQDGKTTSLPYVLLLSNFLYVC